MNSTRPVPIGEDFFSGVRLLASDARVAYLLANEARNRAMARVFGVSRDDSFLLTVVLVGTAAGAVHAGIVKAMKGPGGPTVADAGIGVASLKEAVYWLAGTRPDQTPMVGTLVAIAALEASVGPLRRASVRTVRASSHAMRAGFDHRYGHILSAWRRSG